MTIAGHALHDTKMLHVRPNLPKESSPSSRANFSARASPLCRAYTNTS